MNPFASRFLRPGAIPFLFPEGGSLPQILARLEAQRGWGQIIGPHGSGKSTLLAAVVGELAKGGCAVVQHTLRQGQRGLTPWPPPPGTRQLAIDGYEQLAWWWRWRVKVWCRRRGCGLLITAHRDMGLPPLWTTSPDLPTLKKVVQYLLKAAHDAQPPDSLLPCSDDDLVEAYLAAEGNLREALFRLYDRYQQHIHRPNVAGQPPECCPASAPERSCTQK